MSSGQSQKQRGDDGQQDDERFFREYSKALAQALLENEADGKNNSVPKEQLVKDAYKALCHDDPRVDSDEACRLLASSLTRQNTSYALSEQLVEGVRQATARTERYIADTNSAATVEADDEQPETPSSSLQTIATATAAGYASVAVAIFVKVPLACCQGGDKAQIERYLGSYRGPARQQDDIQTNADLEKETNVVDIQSNLLQDSDGSGNNEGNDQDSLEEIWAEESDPDDYEYESSHTDAAQHLAWHESSFDMDPGTLSRPPVTSDWSDLRHAVANLLTELTYSKLVCLSSRQWKTLRLSDILTQLALTLLVPPPPSDDNSARPLLRDEDDPACVELRRMGIRPLYCLRDRAMDDSTISSSQQEEALNDYLMLVQTLLGVDTVMLQSTTAGSPTPPLAPATVIGMASLSALCSCKKSMRSKIRKCVLENVEDLASVVERAGSTANETDGVPNWVRLILALLPQLHLVTGVQADGTALVGESGSDVLTNSEAQLLLNSGLFREVLLLFTRTQEESSPTCEFARTQLLRALLVLCIQSTSLLGKYAWRVPQLSSCLSRQEWRQSKPLDNVMWLLMGEVILENNSGGGRLRVKSASANTIAPTVDSCRQGAFEGWREMCQRVVQAMESLREMRECTSKLGESSDWKQQHEEAVLEFTRFTNLLVSCPSFCRMWIKSTFAGGVLSSVEKHVHEIRQCVSSIPAAANSQAKEWKDEPKKTAENDKQGSPIVLVVDTNEEHVTNVKKGIKVLSLLLQEGSVQQGSNISSKTD